MTNPAAWFSETTERYQNNGEVPVNSLLLTHQGKLKAGIGNNAITTSGGRGIIADELVDSINFAATAPTAVN